MGSQFNPSDRAGTNAHPEANRASKESKLYGKRSEPVFKGESPADTSLQADTLAKEVGDEYRMQEKLFKPRGKRDAGSGGGQG